MKDKELTDVYKLSSKCQITVPKHVREWLSLGPSDHVIFEKRYGKVSIKKATIVEESIRGKNNSVRNG